LPPMATEVWIPGRVGALYTRSIGHGPPLTVIHGGPDFDHGYLLPDLDRLAGMARLIYYDQAGRGLSAEGVRAEDVSLGSDLEDLDRVREHFGLDATALLGHSFGAVLALEYATRHPDRVSHLILLNPAPASSHDLDLFRAAYDARQGAALVEQATIVDSPAYRTGDPEAVTARYRVHFGPALHRTDDFERLMEHMHAGFVSQGSEGIAKAQAVEDCLMRDTWERPDFDLLPKLRGLAIPTLVVTGADDIVPVDVAAAIADAIPGAELVVIPDCGHFCYLERPSEVRAAVRRLLTSER